MSDRCVDLTKQYIDYNVKEEITDITELKESGTYKFTRPEENKIKWFKFEAKTGDSISLYTNKMSTFEVFKANNNERIYTKTSNKSIEANGFYAPEDGSYYVAVHDVVQNENEVSLYYSHINRYAVICNQSIFECFFNSTYGFLIINVLIVILIEQFIKNVIEGLGYI